MGLGDVVEKALSTVGVTKERVQRWLGKECGCRERQEKLNQLGRWAYRILAGRIDKGEEYLEKIIEDPPSDPAS